MNQLSRQNANINTKIRNNDKQTYFHFASISDIIIPVLKLHRCTTKSRKLPLLRRIPPVAPVIFIAPRINRKVASVIDLQHKNSREEN
jgi:hypothetical protein